MNFWYRLANFFEKFITDDPDDKEIKMELYRDGFPCVIGKKYFTHLRRYVWEPDQGDLVLSNFGGATLCFVVENGAQPGTYWVFYTWSECNLKEKDQFCRKTGRIVCLENFSKRPMRLHTEVRKAIPTVDELRDYVIDQYKICKSKYYHKVWGEYQ